MGEGGGGGWGGGRGGGGGGLFSGQLKKHLDTPMLSIYNCIPSSRPPRPYRTRRHAVRDLPIPPHTLQYEQPSFVPCSTADSILRSSLAGSNFKTTMIRESQFGDSLQTLTNACVILPNQDTRCCRLATELKLQLRQLGHVDKIIILECILVYTSS